MKYTAEIDVMPLKALLDPQGKAVTQTLHNIDYKTVNNVRIGKHITLELEAENIDQAKVKIEEMAKNVLSNPIMEYFEYKIS